MMLVRRITAQLSEAGSHFLKHYRIDRSGWIVVKLDMFVHAIPPLTRVLSRSMRHRRDEII